MVTLRRRTEVCPELLLGFGSSFGLSDSAQVKFGRSGTKFASSENFEEEACGLNQRTPLPNKFVGVVAERDTTIPLFGRQAMDALNRQIAMMNEEMALLK